MIGVLHCYHIISTRGNEPKPIWYLPPTPPSRQYRPIVSTKWVGNGRYDLRMHTNKVNPDPQRHSTSRPPPRPHIGHLHFPFFQQCYSQMVRYATISCIQIWHATHDFLLTSEYLRRRQAIQVKINISLIFHKNCLIQSTNSDAKIFLVTVKVAI